MFFIYFKVKEIEFLLVLAFGLLHVQHGLDDSNSQEKQITSCGGQMNPIDVMDFSLE